MRRWRDAIKPPNLTVIAAPDVDFQPYAPRGVPEA